MDTKEELQADLAQFCGTETWYRHPLGRFSYTDGVKHLAAHAGAYWLIDAIASYQHGRKVKACDFQIWELTVADDQADLTMRHDDGTVIVQQHITYTDFPLPYIKLWLTDGTLLLPQEY